MSAATTPKQPSLSSRGWQVLRVLFFLGGIGLLAYLIQHVGLDTLMEHARRLGWTFLLLIFLFGVLNFLRALSWKICLGNEGKAVPLSTFFFLWISGESIGYFSLGWPGEAFRAAALRDRIPLRKGFSSLLVARMTYFYASMMIMLAGVLAAFTELSQRDGMQTALVIGAVVLTLLLLLPFGGVHLLSKEFRPLHERLARTNPKSLLGTLHRFYHTVTDDLQTVFVQNRRTFYRLLAINLPTAFIGVLEVYLILQILVPGITLSKAIVIEGATKVLGVFSLFVPGNVGVREGGVVLILSQFELAASVGVALALARRARVVVWVLIGCIPLFTQGLYSLAREEKPPADSSDAETEKSQPQS